ncbi:hypothetical protein O181_024809 [Austropuccinia psidii MF-1]|uniref:DUF2428 domain-containing protein n=1 Tax=Austropuccinia psidii MF-1 TaxID=1389203 RepID=A0A9Q3H010_9BASI|nr:hypothetical protein [Austropuccinia psidii MF-1]
MPGSNTSPISSRVGLTTLTAATGPTSTVVVMKSITLEKLNTLRDQVACSFDAKTRRTRVGVADASVDGDKVASVKLEQSDDLNRLVCPALDALLNGQVIPTGEPEASEQEILESSSDKTQQIVSALELINLVFRKLKSSRRVDSKTDPNLNPFCFSCQVEESIGKAIWLHWNSAPGISYKVKATLRNLVEYLGARYVCYHSLPVIHFFLQSIKQSVLLEKRSISILSFILPLLTVEDTLHASSVPVPNPTEFLRILLSALSDFKLASAAGLLAVYWICKVEGWDLEEPLKTRDHSSPRADWISVTLPILLAPEERRRQHLCQHFLALLFKRRPGCFCELSQELRGMNTCQGDSLAPSVVSLEWLSGVIALARANPRRHEVAKLSIKDNNDSELLITPGLLKICLSHPSVSLRSSALAILCQSPAISSPVPFEHLDLLYAFFRWNFGEVKAELKQEIFSNLSSLVIRLRESACVSSKRLSELKVKESTFFFAPGESHAATSHCNHEQRTDLQTLMEKHKTYLQAVKSFMIKLVTLCQINLTISSPYRNQIASLRYIKVLLDSGIDQSYKPMLSEKKPVPIARFPFGINITDSPFIKALVIGLTSTYMDIREAAFMLLQNSSVLESTLQPDIKLNGQVLSYAVQCLNSKRASQTCTATLLLRLILEKQVIGGSYKVPPPLLPRHLPELGSITPLAIFFIGRLEKLEEKIHAAEVDLMMACESQSAQGSLLIISELFKSLSPAMISSLVSSSHLSDILKKTWQLVNRVWQFSALVLCHSTSNEGDSQVADDNSVPDHEEARACELLLEDEEDGMSDDESPLQENDQLAAGPRHKIILSVCWRSMKEASALLTQAVRLSIKAKEQIGFINPDSLFSVEDLKEIGQMFQRWLLEIRHRGAFTAIHRAYSALCEELCRISKSPQASSTSRLPALWLESHIAVITSRKLSTTRRSAGLPFCILSTCQALCIYDPKQLLSSLNRILDLSEKTDSSPESQVHILNTLKILFTDSKVSGKITSLLIERSYKFAIQSFVSCDWRVRNGALILFSGLTTRVFAARPLASTRSHAVLCKRETVMDFFRRLPTLHHILLVELRRSIDAGLHKISDTQSQSPMFAVLSLIALLQNPNQAGAAKDFRPLVQECLDSKVAKIRSISAEAMTGLVSCEEIPSLICELLTEAAGLCSYNRAHGLLLLTKSLIEMPDLLSAYEKSTIRAVLPLPATVFLYSASRPLFCQSTFLDILQGLEKRFDIVLDSVCKPLPSLILQDFQNLQRVRAPALDSYKAKVIRNLLSKDLNKSTLVMLLSNDSASTRLLALEFLQGFASEEIANDIEIMQVILQIARNHSESTIMKLSSLEFISKGFSCFTTSQWSIEKILSDSEATHILPIRNSLLIIAAINIVNTVHLQDDHSFLNTWANKFLAQAVSCAHEDQDTETRLSAAKALSVFSKVYVLLSLNDSINFLDLAMTLIQDDDDEVRSVLVEGLVNVREIVDGIPMVEAAVLEQLVKLAIEMSLDFPFKRLMKAKVIEADLKRLHKPSQLLFAKERPNLFRDDLIEYDFLQKLARENLSTIGLESMQIPVEELNTFNMLLFTLTSQDFNYPENLLDATKQNNLISQKAWQDLALRVIVAADVLQKLYNYHLKHNELIAVESLKRRSTCLSLNIVNEY